MKPTDQTAAALNWIFLHSPRIDLAVRQWIDGRAVWIAPDRPRGKHLAGLGRDGIDKLRPFLSARNSDHSDIFWRPVPPTPLIMLDDLAPDSARHLALKYAGLAVQTSRDKAQIWLIVERPVDVQERHDMQVALIARHGADRGASGGRQVGRLPGYRNHKPQYSDDPPWVNLLLATEGRAHPFLISPAARGGARGSGSFQAKQGADDEATRARAARGEMATIDESARDWFHARSRMEQGVSDELILQEIAERALRRGKRSTWRECVDYATRTVQNARKKGC